MAKEWLVIENKGEVEENAIALMGASTKRGEGGKIGQFGTGFKYGLATLIREGIEPIIFSGEQKISFFTRAQQLKKSDFWEVVMKTGQKVKPLGFTTELGLGWTVERALTDLISNAYDEDEGEVQHARTYRDKGQPKGLEGWTRIYLSLSRDKGGRDERLDQFLESYDRYFDFDRPKLEVTPRGSLMEPNGPGVRVYRRGVLVWDSPSLNSLYDYDIPQLPVREDRRAEEYVAKHYVFWFLQSVSVERKALILKSVSRNQKGFEAECHSPYYSDASWKEAAARMGMVTVTTPSVQALLGESRKGDELVVPDGWHQVLVSSGVVDLKEKLREGLLEGWKDCTEDIAESESEVLRRAEEFLEEAGWWSSPPPVPVVVFEAEEGAPLGKWSEKDQMIYVNRENLKMGVRQAAQTLLEEECHRRSGCVDETRRFQEYLFRQWLEEMCKRVGRTL